MRRGIALVVLALVGVIAAVVAVATSGVLSPAKAVASSHREAPLISADPSVDNTDLYAFVSPDRQDTVTLVANYIPFEDPAGGPNYYKFDDSALYELKVDNNGDGKEDISYQFRFQTKLVNPNTFLYNTNQVTSATDTDLSVLQTYSVTRVQGHSRTVLGTDLPVPPPNIGPRSTPDYDNGAGKLGDGTNGAVRDLPGGIKVFVGPRDDPFFVDLGSIFDLGGLRPFNPVHLIPLPGTPGRDGVAGYSVHSIAIQVPIVQLVRDLNPTIGVYASASRPKVRILGGHDGKPRTEGPLIQVSRLGNPLVNEVVIPLGKKDRWNASDPSNDSQFLSNYTNPELAADINLLYTGFPAAVLMPIPTTGRSDLVAVLLTGVPTLNFTGNTQADLLRLNTSIPVATSPNRLGVLAGDFQGFPNGRRLTDDVTDIELRAVACGYGPILNSALGLCDLTPNDIIGDGVDTNDVSFLSTFPYVASPNDGYNHTGHK